MKTKSGIIMCILMLASIINMSFASSQGYSSLDLENIEMLSSGENNGFCLGTGSVDCPKTSIKAILVAYY
ncbi:hypothetical protein AGMMS50239_24870 [Bacteroidia bacterium]|nr:hypothetical protein AGMMS50239_24870 [Bacteroidia bacterium]